MPAGPWKRCKRRLVAAIGPWLVLAGLYLLGCTWRIRVSGLRHLRAARAAGTPVIGAGLHARSLPMAYAFNRPALRPCVSLSSSSRDGQMMARVLRGMGMAVVGGSSGSDGARGFIALVRHLRQHPEQIASILVDGGRGPRGHCKAGVVQLAQRTGGLVLPVVLSASPALIAHRSWDRQVLPLPFARIHIAVGPLLLLPMEGTVEVQRRRIERLLLRRTAQQDRRLGFHDPEPLQIRCIDREGTHDGI